MTVTGAELALAALAVYGLCFGAQNKLPAFVYKLPFFSKLLRCAYCTGTWAGVAVGTFLVCRDSLPALAGILGMVALWAAAGAGLCYVVHSIMVRIDFPPDE